LKNHFFFHISESDLQNEQKVLELFGIMQEIKKKRILEPMESFLYYLGVPKSEFFLYTRKEIEYHLEKLNERIAERNKAGSSSGKDVVSANDPMVQSLMPNPAGRPRPLTFSVPLLAGRRDATIASFIGSDTCCPIAGRAKGSTATTLPNWNRRETSSASANRAKRTTRFDMNNRIAFIATCLLLVLSISIGVYFGEKSLQEGHAICEKNGEVFVSRKPRYVFCKRADGVVIMRSE
jgi:hypothetical protein